MKKAVDGLILREREIGENDKLLTILTADEGKIYMTAKGARSMRSRVTSSCRLFSYANIEYYEREDRRWVSGGSVNYGFFELCDDLVDFSLACYISQIAEEISGEGVEARDLLRATLNGLYCIEKKKRPREQVKAAYEILAVRMSGMTPDVSCCARCGKTHGGMFWLDVMNGCLICDECQKKESGSLPLPETDELNFRNILMPLDDGALRALRFLLKSHPRQLYNFAVHGESERLLCAATETYMLNHLERNFNTLDFYKSIAKLSPNERD